MLIYNTVFLFLVLCALLDLADKKNFFLFTLSFIVLLILMGFRGNGGDDFLVYQQYFNSLPIILYDYGVGYFYLNSFAKYFGNYEFFIFVSSLLCLSLQSFFIYSETEKPCLVLLLFYSTSFLWLDFILIRQSIAVGFFVVAISLYKNSRNKLSFLFFVFSALFHETAFFAAALFYIFSKLEKKGILIAILILLILSPFLSDILVIINNITIKNKNVELYLGEHALPSIANIAEFLMAVLAFIIIKKDDIFRNSKEYRLYKVIIIASFCILVLSYTVPTLARFLEYYRLFYFLLLTRMFMYFNLRSRYMIFIALTVYGFVRMNSFIYQFDSGFDYIFNGSSI
ncbi:EpsG family protein [Salmonella enterica]|uniref:O-antigen polymerase n=1 Tax=Salmonella enterica TaxID=28901 RepID=U3GKV7_SALER|nr:EpsG family protein [Salmonella enterica]APW69043.1 hypothetical protein LFZ4_11080 [Salmonella enterica subsp. enterica serovar Antsalova str. S01-0511]EBS0794791.1 EpsG family protein [Salmonella enterica subsp. enterica serovar Overschie]EBZ5137410.1 EpsG family protein [Salmonella enterica subsp. enterica serovar Antsalova]ECA9859779.1 EpsG family protein [Salmonella enterica subsp. enterica serovar Gokul]ECB7315312.1 EpsG family protein [Salmonella enterica subsp. enterica serovar Tref